MSRGRRSITSYGCLSLQGSHHTKYSKLCVFRGRVAVSMLLPCVPRVSLCVHAWFMWFRSLELMIRR